MYYTLFREVDSCMPWVNVCVWVVDKLLDDDKWRCEQVLHYIKDVIVPIDEESSSRDE